MNNSTLAQTDVCRAFYAALLMTGNSILAEAAVLSAIEAVDARALSGGSLMAEVLSIAVRFRTDWYEPQANRLIHPEPELPVELQKVLKLPTEPRHAFVLRMLLGLSLEESACLLESEPSEVSARAIAASEKLAATIGIVNPNVFFLPRAAAVA